jgi:hypothetical protein
MHGLLLVTAQRLESGARDGPVWLSGVVLGVRTVNKSLIDSESANQVLPRFPIPARVLPVELESYSRLASQSSGR